MGLTEHSNERFDTMEPEFPPTATQPSPTAHRFAAEVDLPTPATSMGLDATLRREGVAGYSTLFDGDRSVVIFRGDCPSLGEPVLTQRFIDEFGSDANVFASMADGWYNRPRPLPVDVVGSSGVPFWRSQHPAATGELQPVTRGITAIPIDDQFAWTAVLAFSPIVAIRATFGEVFQPETPGELLVETLRRLSTTTDVGMRLGLFESPFVAAHQHPSGVAPVVRLADRRPPGF